MKLFRVFKWDGRSSGRRRGGPLHVARERQGVGRHDAPEKYGAWYCACDAVSAVAEAIQFARGQVLTDADLVAADRSAWALVALELGGAAPLPDLDDPRELLTRGLRPSQAATRRRSVTQRIASAIFDEGAAGFQWWSTLDAEWINVTLFHERALAHVRVAAAPRLLSVRSAEVREAAARLGVRIQAD